MKTLLIESVRPKGVGKGSQIKTAFNSTEVESAKYYDLSKLSGSSVVLEYSYSEGDSIKTTSERIGIPAGLDEMGVKTYIIAEIQSTLGK